MIDLHTHIIPGIDDGAKDAEESVKILEELKNQGVDTIVFTPHYYCQNRSVDDFLQQRSQAFDSIKDIIPNGIKTVLGAEVNIDNYRSKDFKYLSPLAISGTDYILIEMPHSAEWNSALLVKIENLIDTTYLTPIIAHAEKFSSPQKNPSLISELISMGCLIQCTCDSFLHDMPFAKTLLKKRQVHCLGSDAHNMKERFPIYNDGSNFLAKQFGQSQLDIIQNNMKLILQNKPV